MLCDNQLGWAATGEREGFKGGRGEFGAPPPPTPRGVWGTMGILISKNGDRSGTDFGPALGRKQLPPPKSVK